MSLKTAAPILSQRELQNSATMEEPITQEAEEPASVENTVDEENKDSMVENAEEENRNLKEVDTEILTAAATTMEEPVNIEEPAV